MTRPAPKFVVRLFDPDNYYYEKKLFGCMYWSGNSKSQTTIQERISMFSFEPETKTIFYTSEGIQEGISDSKIKTPTKTSSNWKRERSARLILDGSTLMQLDTGFSFSSEPVVKTVVPFKGTPISIDRSWSIQRDLKFEASNSDGRIRYIFWEHTKSNPVYLTLLLKPGRILSLWNMHPDRTSPFRICCVYFDQGDGYKITNFIFYESIELLLIDQA